MKEIEYNQSTWRNMSKLAKRIDSKHQNDAFPGYVDGRIPMGNDDKKAKRFARLLSWLLGQSEPFEMFHPATGEMRAIQYSPTSYFDCSVGIYIEQQ